MSSESLQFREWRADLIPRADYSLVQATYRDYVHDWIVPEDETWLVHQVLWTVLSVTSDRVAPNAVGLSEIVRGSMDGWTGRRDGTFYVGRPQAILGGHRTHRQEYTAPAANFPTFVLWAPNQPLVLAPNDRLTAQLVVFGQAAQPTLEARISADYAVYELIRGDAADGVVRAPVNTSEWWQR